MPHMPIHKTLPIVSLFLAFTLSPAAHAADDWPQWRGPDRTGHVPAGVPVPTTLPSQPKVLWHVPVGFAVASPVVAEGRVIYLDEQKGKEVVHAADAESGNVLWSVELDDATKDAQSPSGPRCTPVVDAGRVYAQSCRGELKCLAATDGKLLWRTNYTKDFGAVFIGEKGKAEGATRHGNNGSPIVDGDHLLCGVGGKDGAGYVCFDKADGRIVWRSTDHTPAYASPIIATVAGRRQFISFDAQGVTALDPADGKPLWQVPVKTALARHAATPVVVDDMVIVSSHQAGLIGIKVTREGDALKAERAWEEKHLAINFASPVIVAGHLYGVGPAENLICVDAHTGKPAWSKDEFFHSPSGKEYAGILAMGQNLLILTDGGDLVMVAADPAGYRELGRATVCGNNWCIPAYAGGKLYLRDARELKCVQLMP